MKFIPLFLLLACTSKKLQLSLLKRMLTPIAPQEITVKRLVLEVESKNSNELEDEEMDCNCIIMPSKIDYGPLPSEEVKLIDYQTMPQPPEEEEEGSDPLLPSLLRALLSDETREMLDLCPTAGKKESEVTKSFSKGSEKLVKLLIERLKREKRD